MTNLELLNYALIGVTQSADTLQRYEEPSDDRLNALCTLKSDRAKIERQILALKMDNDKIVNIMN